MGRTTTIYGSLEPVWGSKSKEGEVRHQPDTRRGMTRTRPVAHVTHVNIAWPRTRDDIIPTL